MDKRPEETFNIRQLRQAINDTAVIPAAVLPKPDTTRPAPTGASLVCISAAGPGRGKRFPLGARGLTIGRDAKCGLGVPDHSVSRVHARIDLQSNGTYQVTDLGSTNGTYINDRRVHSETLNDGSCLRFGDCCFRFLMDGNVETVYHDELNRLSVIDPLTGLHNRRYLDEFLDAALDRAAQTRQSVAVVLFDVDHFKAINDRLGHPGGDSILRTLATRLQAVTRAGELLARYGGEEFALVLPATTLDSARACAERVRHMVDCCPCNYQGQLWPVTVSAGVGLRHPDDPLTAADLLRQADEALYQAKRAGRNQVAAYAASGPGETHCDCPNPLTLATPVRGSAE